MIQRGETPPNVRKDIGGCIAAQRWQCVCRSTTLSCSLAQNRPPQCQALPDSACLSHLRLFSTTSHLRLLPPRVTSDCFPPCRSCLFSHDFSIRHLLRRQPSIHDASLPPDADDRPPDPTRPLPGSVSSARPKPWAQAQRSQEAPGSADAGAAWLGRVSNAYASGSDGARADGKADGGGMPPWQRNLSDSVTSGAVDNRCVGGWRWPWPPSGAPSD